MAASSTHDIKHITTVVELREAWTDVARRLHRDVDSAYRFRDDPTGTFRSLGYQLTPETARALRASMP